MITLPAAPAAPAPPCRCTPSFRWIARRAGTLGIPALDLLTCTTMGALQVLVKRRYHALALECHPDVLAAKQRSTGHRPRHHIVLAQRFQRLTATYQWFMALDPRLAVSPYAGIAEHEAALPWAMDRRPLDLGVGWQVVAPGY